MYSFDMVIQTHCKFHFSPNPVSGNHDLRVSLDKFLILGADYMAIFILPELKIQLGKPSWKKFQLYEKFQPGLKHKSLE